MTDRNSETKKMVEGALADEKQLASIAETLSVGSRRERQQAAAVLSQVTKAEPAKMVPYIEVLIDALNRPEAQTRWECLEMLTILVEHDVRACSKAINEAETSLFDEESGPVRLGAMRFLCKLGATTANRSEKVWPLIDEGIQCYHGDLEFADMMNAVIEFSNGKLSNDVKKALIERMTFDATNSKGSLQRRAQQVIDNVSPKTAS